MKKTTPNNKKKAAALFLGLTLMICPVLAVTLDEIKNQNPTIVNNLYNATVNTTVTNVTATINVNHTFIGTPPAVTNVGTPSAALLDFTIPNGDPSIAWPIGSVFISTVSTNPNTLLGFGTWTLLANGNITVT